MSPREAKPARCVVHRILVPLLFLAVLGVGMAVRLHRIGEEGLHADEMTTLMWAHEPTFKDAFSTARKFDPPMTPVYFLMQYAWVRVFGFGLMRLHLLSVLFSAATLAAVFALGRRIAGTRAGLFAMLLLAVSPIHVYYSLEIRNYSLTALLGVLSLLTLLRGVERPGWRAWTLNFVVDLLLGLSHLFANLLFVPQALFLLLCRRRRGVLFPWLLSHVLVTAAVVVWLGTCDFSAIRRASAYMPPLSIENGLEMIFSITGASYRYVGSAPVGLQGVAGWSVVVLFAVGLLALLGNAVRSRHRCMKGLDAGCITRGVAALARRACPPRAAVGDDGSLHALLLSAVCAVQRGCRSGRAGHRGCGITPSGGARRAGRGHACRGADPTGPHSAQPAATRLPAADLPVPERGGEAGRLSGHAAPLCRPVCHRDRDACARVTEAALARGALGLV